MAHTRIFDALRRALRLAHGANRLGIEPRELAEASIQRWRASRRELLKAGLGAAALGALPLGLSRCAEDDTVPAAAPGVRIGIVGGGMAGLHCAYTLKKAGVTARVFEASTRSGGRMYSLRGKYPDAMVAELGGELIDTPHVTMRGLAEELGIQLDDLFVDEPAGYARDTFFVGGKVVPLPDLVISFTPVAAKMAEAVAAAEAKGADAEFEKLDNMNIVQWLDEVAKADGVIGPLLKEAYTGEYGLESEEQSAFNLLYLIDYETPDPFSIFGESDERYHTHLGNDTFPTKLAAALDGQIELGMRLEAVKSSGSGAFTLTFDQSGTKVDETFDHVVFALPFTLLREVDLSGLELPADKKQLIAELGYGTNAKIMTGYTTRTWREKQNASGAAITDNGVQFLWDTSRGQEGAHGILTNFAGGKYGVHMGEGTEEERAQEIVPKVDEIFPGAKDAYMVGSTVRMHWPTHPHTKGSYACYKPGQWATWGLEGERAGNLHFCGEHCSKDNQGFMEGAAETGGFAAAEILDDLGIKPAVKASALHVMAPKLRFRGASYPPSGGRRLTWLEHRRLVRAATGRNRS